MALSGTALAAVTLSVAVLAVKSMVVLAAGGDFRVFFAAGWMLRHGADPYNSTALLGAIARVTAGPPPQSFLLFPYAPWFGMIMAPVALLPYWVAFGMWEGVSCAAVALASWRWGVALGWRHPRWWALAAALSTPALFNYTLGQVSTLALALLVGSLLAARSSHFGWAGALAVAGALLKPQDLWPLVPLLWLVPPLVPASRALLGRLLVGQAAAALFLLGAPLLLKHQLMAEWLGLLGYFGSHLTVQTELVGLSGLLGFAPASWHLTVGVSDPLVLTLMLVGGAGTALAVMRLRSHPGLSRIAQERRIGWLVLLPIACWMVVTPYGHDQDLVMVFPLTMLVLGDGAEILSRALTWVLLTSLLALPFVTVFFGDSLFPPESLAPLGLLVLVGAAGLALHRELGAAKQSTTGERVVVQMY